jgi:hypothetical protein
MALLTALTLHICACGTIETWRVFTCYEPEGLTVHTDVLVCTVALKLAQSIDANPIMLARVGRTFININIASVSKKIPCYIYLSIITTVF